MNKIIFRSFVIFLAGLFVYAAGRRVYVEYWQSRIFEIANKAVTTNNVKFLNYYEKNKYSLDSYGEYIDMQILFENTK